MNIAQALAYRGKIDSYERQENAWLLEHILNISALQFKLCLTQELTALQEQTYLDGLKRIQEGEPLAYILGSQPFWTLDLNVTKDTLVPRPDTEILVETCLHLALPENASVIDLGTGTGAIALSLASERPTWQVLATDIYLPTLEVAKANALKHHLLQVGFKLGAWFAALNDQPELRFDLIVSNPPYIDAEDSHMQDLAAEPERALVATQQGLADFDIIIAQAQYWLNPNGWVALEHGYDQANAVQQIFHQHGFSQIRSIKDYGGNDRVTLARLELVD